MTEEVQNDVVEEAETEETGTETRASRKPRGEKQPKPKLNKDGLPVGEQVDFETIMKIERKRQQKAETK